MLFVLNRVEKKAPQQRIREKKWESERNERFLYIFLPLSSLSLNLVRVNHDYNFSFTHAARVLWAMGCTLCSTLRMNCYQSFFILLVVCFNVYSVIDKNPAPGICLPIIVKFCQNHHVPYNYTIYPNYIGHFSQIEAEEDLEPYEAIVDVQCYELASLFLCTLFVPKCGAAGLIPPCKSLCSGKCRVYKTLLLIFIA